MKCERGSCIVPVTSLAFSSKFLLTGEGAYLKVYDQSTHHLVNEQRVFSGSTVHGIVRDPNNADSVFCVFGSKQLAIVQLEENGDLKELSKECTLSDWIWCIRWLQDDHQGSQCSQLALALAHNIVLRWDWKQRQCLEQVKCEEKCILYCAHFIGDTWSDLVLAAGTVFNQVVLWKPYDSGNTDRNVLHRLSGHQGVIFSIEYHPTKRLLCSTSDDRSVCMWKVERNVTSEDGARDTLSGDIAWKTATFTLQHVLYGHTARVWGVKLLQDWCITIGEDATCIMWDYSGVMRHKLKGHKGKSIRSLAVNESETLLATGGGDASIHIWNVHSEEQKSDVTVKNTTHQLPTHATDFPRTIKLVGIELLVASNEGCEDCERLAENNLLVMTNEGLLRRYDPGTASWNIAMSDDAFRSYTVLAVYQGLVAAGNIHGTLRIISIETGKQTDISAYSGKVFSVQWLDHQRMLTTGPNGSLDVWEYYFGRLRRLFHYVLPYTKQHWVSAAMLVHKYNVLVCGDRGGTLHVYDLDSKCEQPTQSFPRIHGKAGVTDVTFHGDHVYSCGRDGLYRVYRLTEDKEWEWSEEATSETWNGPPCAKLELLEANRVFKGFEWLARMMFVNGDLWIMGFNSAEFVVFSVAENQRLLSISCGGGHRAWDFKYNAESSQATFSYLKTHDIVTCTADMQLRKHTLLKASLHGREVNDVKHLMDISGPGGSMSSVMATAGEDGMVKIVSINQPSKGHHHTSPYEILTTIQGHISSVRCLAVSLDASTSHHLLFSAGGRAHLKAWRVGGLMAETTSSYLSSLHFLPSAPSSSPQCWSEYLTTHMLHHKGLKHSKPWKKASYNPNPETRYMQLSAFAAREVDERYLDSCHIVAAACSDGFVRVFGFDEKAKAFHHLAHSEFHDHCVLSVKHHISTSTNQTAVNNRLTNQDAASFKSSTNQDASFKNSSTNQTTENNLLTDDKTSTTNQDGASFKSSTNQTPCTKAVYLLSSATDGRVALWDIRTVVKDFCQIMQRKHSDDEETDVHKLELLDLGKPQFVLEAHQSGVNSIDVLELEGGELLIASGGDDNAVSVHCVQRKPPSSQWTTGWRIHKPDAHATQITGVKFLSQDMVVTSSIDQRLSFWSYSIDTAQMQLECSQFFDVSDASALEVWRDKENRHCYASVCGVGLQTFTIQHKDDNL